jgi:hypothetical protein
VHVSNPTLSLLDPAVGNDPYPLYAHLRREAPVAPLGVMDLCGGPEPGDADGRAPRGRAEWRRREAQVVGTYLPPSFPRWLRAAQPQGAGTAR